MNETDLLALVQQYMADKALIVVVVLMVLGYFLKRTPHVQDWMIPWSLTVVGIILACGILQSFTVESVVQGILAAGIANLTHQLWKQTTDKRESDQDGN
ncbi:phage holin family protein [Brevibacillus nitrificans]|uniref:phage holin family protein n=1 Tax=Brevibacillus nitrificans TaxID=651560 RepID=UPI0028555183|nr:phage holin family protein [Brevibacillus nitrificans]MDR7318933.1 protein-S-isoprenylcysteine O-methyltransferase Ste14 [Brevibacillus nitrificans]